MMKTYSNTDILVIVMVVISLLIGMTLVTVDFINEQKKDIIHIECEQWLSYRITDTTHYICYNEDGTYNSMENTIIKQWKHKQRQQ